MSEMFMEICLRFFCAGKPPASVVRVGLLAVLMDLQNICIIIMKYLNGSGMHAA